MTDILDHLQPDSPLYEATRYAAREEIIRLRSLNKELAEALDRLLNAHPEDESRMDYDEWPADMKAAQDEWLAARENAEAALTKYRGKE